MTIGTLQFTRPLVERLVPIQKFSELSFFMQETQVQVRRPSGSASLKSSGSR